MTGMPGMGVMAGLPVGFADRMIYGWRKKRSLVSLFKTLAHPESQEQSPPKQEAKQEEVMSATGKKA